MKHDMTIEQAVARLEQLMQAANIKDDPLLDYVVELANENERLKKSLLKLRQTSYAKASMHSKLSDALRE